MLQGSVVLGIFSFLLAWIVQSFFANVLLNIVDAVFMCYAMDRDTQVLVYEPHIILRLDIRVANHKAQSRVCWLI